MCFKGRHHECEKTTFYRMGEKFCKLSYKGLGSTIDKEWLLPYNKKTT